MIRVRRCYWRHWGVRHVRLRALGRQCVHMYAYCGCVRAGNCVSVSVCKHSTAQHCVSVWVRCADAQSAYVCVEHVAADDSDGYSNA